MEPHVTQIRDANTVKKVDTLEISIPLGVDAGIGY
jgi:hypothetical protein